ncbi:copper amine oxidase N-terminal domain-containing protein [Paenibacillus sepulcri]|uniref:Copper amine oxidase N-terminal domain-containing protein n=1 Tax=Paenibacillus sepulcri TaxID=359917 RepID=A0ABS7C6X1_9BACL|nr:copper amine oxidase N-terminal domain-containing protein [Paenibacillus sepulcri]
MIKWFKTAAAVSLLLAGTMTASMSAYGAAPVQPQVFIDGKLQEQPILLQGYTLVQLIAFNDPEWVSYSYDAPARTVVITNPSQNMTVMLQEGVTEANVNGTRVKLDAPVQIIFGRTYVPLRFLSETLGGTVDYITATRQAIVRTPSGEADYRKLMTGSLPDARNIAANLSPIPLEKGLTPLGEGFSEDYVFPQGEALRFTKEYKGLISYIEINEQGLAEVKWQKDTWSASGKYRESGSKPPAFGESTYFMYNFSTPAFIKYGTIGSDGKVSDLPPYAISEQRGKSREIFNPVEGEQRTDKR